MRRTPLITLLLPFMLLMPGCAVGTGMTAPDFTMRDLAGETHTLSALRGEAVLLDFWAVW